MEEELTLRLNIMHQLPICREKETEQEREKERKGERITVHPCNTYYKSALWFTSRVDVPLQAMPASAVDTVALHCCLGKLLADGFGSLRLQDVSFIKEEESERVLIITATREILRHGGWCSHFHPLLADNYHSSQNTQITHLSFVSSTKWETAWPTCDDDDAVFIDEMTVHLHILTLRTQSSRAVLSALTFSLTHLASVTGRWRVALPPSLPLTLRTTHRPLAPLLPDSIYCRAHKRGCRLRKVNSWSVD